MPAVEEVVRPYQLPENAQGQPYTPPNSLTSNAPIVVTPGFGSSGAGQLPPLLKGSGHFDETITFYVKQASVEKPKNGSSTRLRIGR